MTYIPRPAGIVFEAMGIKRPEVSILSEEFLNEVRQMKEKNLAVEMLKKLGTDYLDLLYIHAPWDDVNWLEAIPQIDELIDDGVVRGLGVSNFTIADMQNTQKIAKHPIVANQMNYNVLFKNEVTEIFKDYCSENNIKIIAYQPVKRQEVLENETIQSIASEHNVSAAQIALAWLLTKNALPIPKAVNKDHIDENVDSVDVKLSKPELELLDNLA